MKLHYNFFKKEFILECDCKKLNSKISLFISIPFLKFISAFYNSSRDLYIQIKL